jgi:CheY-like chemotaxis protein
MKRERILVIAKDDYLASQVGNALRQAGYRVWRARDGVDGLKKLQRASPDLVVMERELSLLNREDPCSRIRQASYIPIIAVGNEQDAPEVLEFGADAYVAKPPNLRELTARVRAMLWRKNREEPPWDNNNTGTTGRFNSHGDNPGRSTRPMLATALYASIRADIVLRCRQLISLIVMKLWGACLAHPLNSWVRSHLRTYTPRLPRYFEAWEECIFSETDRVLSKELLDGGAKGF